MASTMFARPSSPTPLSVHATLPNQAALEPVLAKIPTPEAFTRPSTPSQSPPATPTTPHMPSGYIPRRRSAIIVTSTGPCSFTPRRRNALVPLPLLPPVPPDAIVTSVKILHNDNSNQNSSYSFGSHCHPANGRQNYGAEITCGGITFTNSFACSPPARRRRSSLNPQACAAAAANLAAAAHAQAQTPPRKESVQDVTMTDANVPAATAAATGTDQLVTVISSPTLTKTANRNGEDKQPDSPTKTSFFFSPLARSRNQRRRTSCTPCNVPAPIQTTKAAHGKPSPPPTAPLPPTPTTPITTVSSIPMPTSMPPMLSTPMPIAPRPVSPTVPATPNNSIDGAPLKPRSTIVVTVRMSPSASRRDAFTPPPSPWPRDSPFPWSNAYSGNPKPTRDLVLAQKETTVAANPVTEAVANVMAMDVDPTPLVTEREVPRPRLHRSAPAMHNPAFLASIRLKNERSRRLNMPHPSPGVCPAPSVRRNGPVAPLLPAKPLWSRPRVSSRLVTRPSMTPESMDAASHTVSLGGNRITAQLSPQFSADQLYISQPTLHPRLPGRTVSSSRLISDTEPTASSSGFTGSAYVARASGIRSVAGKPMRAANKSASKSGGLPMLRTAVLNNSGPDVGRRILAMGVRLAQEIYEAEEDLARQEKMKVKEEDRMDIDMEVKEESTFQSLPPPPRSRYPRSRSQPRAQPQSQSSVEEDADMDVEKFLEHYVTGGDVEMEDVQAERVDLKKEESNEKEKKQSQDTQTPLIASTVPTATKATAVAEDDDAKENRPTQAIMATKTMATIQDTNDRRFSSEMV